MAGTSNAVNLTDGLDGLAIGPTMIAAAAYMILAYCVGTALQFPISLDGGETQYMTFNFAEYLKLPHVAGASELAIFASTIIGAGIGFLWFNTFPAKVLWGMWAAFSWRGFRHAGGIDEE